ncbi:MAG: S41 family peptidase [Clostridiales bacterium]|jgi:carboxyl-terminal processing protease|nr:S41 family peptidase [Clostridiales bacterium]
MRWDEWVHDKKSFVSGVLAGMALLVLFNTAFHGFKLVFDRMANKPMAFSVKVNELLNVLDAHSINPYKKEDLLENMYRGLVSGVGDPYTYYFDKKALADFMQQTEGSYAGIGVVVTSDPKDHLVTVVTAYEGSPGAAAGLMPGDKFMKIDGLDVSSASLEEVTAMTKGPVGTTVKITIYRGSEKRTFDVEVIRRKIDIPTVTSKMLADQIGYLRISAFDRVTLDQFKTAYQSLSDQKMRGLIVDLRNNPGGLLDVVTKIADILVPQGTIVYTEDKSGKKEYTYSDENGIPVPLALLVNGASASASEVLSGAVKDLNVGVLVGTKTFGKGIVQNLYTLSDGSAIKVTVSKYYTPSGVCIQGDGIIPDYVVEMSDELTAKISSLSEEEDIQLEKAEEIIEQLIKEQT